MVRGRVWYSSNCRWPQRKNIESVRSGDLSGHSIGPLRQIQLLDSQLANEITWRPILLKVKRTSYCEWYFIHTRFQYSLNYCRHSVALTRPRNNGSKAGFPCIAQETGFLGLVWCWASTATWLLSCAQYTVLCRVMYQLKWSHVSPLDVTSSIRINCDLKRSKHSTRWSASHSCQSCTKCIVVGWNT